MGKGDMMQLKEQPAPLYNFSHSSSNLQLCLFHFPVLFCHNLHTSLFTAFFFFNPYKQKLSNPLTNVWSFRVSVGLTKPLSATCNSFNCEASSSYKTSETVLPQVYSNSPCLLPYVTVFIQVYFPKITL